jgi:hypothetical protein
MLGAHRRFLSCCWAFYGQNGYAAACPHFSLFGCHPKRKVLSLQVLETCLGDFYCMFVLPYLSKFDSSSAATIVRLDLSLLSECVFLLKTFPAVISAVEATYDFSAV